MFRPAKQSRVFQDIVDQIQETILSGNLKAGDILPSERDLREVFQVSRGTVREALRVLEQKGLVEMKLGVGGGAVIKNASVNTVSESLALLIRSQKASLSHLAEFRQGVEGDIAAIAAKRASVDAVKKLERLLEKAREYLDLGTDCVERFLEVDKEIHMALAQITGNPVYESLEYIVQENIIPYYDTFLKMEAAEMRENWEDLRDIVRAVKEARSGDARFLAGRHVSRFNTYMEKVDGQK